MVIWCLMLQPVKSQDLENTANCKHAYQAIFKLKLSEGKQLLDREKKENPSNYLPYFIENYIDFLKLFINDNEKLYKSIEPNVKARLEKLSEANPESPYYLYTQADIHLQWAFCKIKFGEYISAVFEVKKAYALLQTNQKKYPDFKPNIKSLGLLHTLFGAVPDKYKFGIKLLGLKGSIEQGLTELSTVMDDKQFEFKEETIILYTLLVLHLQKDKAEAWSMIENADIPLGDNLLNHFVAATVASYTGKNEKVVSILSGKPSGAEYYPFPYLDFLLGNAKLNQLDEDAATYIKKFIAANKGRSYQKEAYRKLAWYYLVNDNPSLYKKYMQQLQQVSDAPTDEDKSAQREAQRGIIPNKQLLKARILSDGSYFTKALAVLNTVNPDKLTRSRDQVEYYYRRARILHEMENYNDAIKYYALTIQKGEAYNYYFAANASLKLASVYEKQQNKPKALLYYQKAVDLEKDEYHNSIEAEAKAGMNRLGK
jgi:hypothetical protein